MTDDKLGRVLRTVAIILISLTAAMNILGGVGTTCAAFLTKQFPPMWPLLEYQWLYQIFVVVTTLIGLVGVWATIRLVRGGDKALRNALIVLVLGVVIGAIHVYTSLTLRGKATPADVKLYLNILTLVYFLLLFLPGIRERVHFTKDASPIDRSTAGGLAAIMTGAIVLSTHIWAGPSHTFMGDNWVFVLQGPLTLVGWGLLAVGAALLFRVMLSIFIQEFNSRSASQHR